MVDIDKAVVDNYVCGYCLGHSDCTSYPELLFTKPPLLQTLILRSVTGSKEPGVLSWTLKAVSHQPLK